MQDTFDERKLSRQEDNSDKKVLEQEVVSIIRDIDVIDLAVEKIPVFYTIIIILEISEIRLE